MTTLLVVPIYLDALVLKKPTAVVEAFADFSRLPHFDGKRDVNPDIPNLSEEILSQPFENQNLYLEAGVHLHWALPDALTMARRRAHLENAEFPSVPNRWLVTRIHQGERQWVVESDFLYPYLFSFGLQGSVELDSLKVSEALRNLFQQNDRPLGSTAAAAVVQAGTRWAIRDADQTYLIAKENNALNVYLRSTPDTNSTPNITYPASIDPYRPFGYLGRRQELQAWQNETNESKNIYLNKLIGVGYGEPAFAAFYPNCHSVFGFWDNFETDINNLRGAAYEVLGWYSNNGQDYLSKWIEQFKNANSLRPPSLDEQLASLLNSDKWQVSDPGKNNALMERMVCFGRITIDEKALLNSKSTQGAEVSIAVGNTSTEALSALLANQLTSDKNTKTIIEDQLEAMHLASSLDKRLLDIGPKFKEARHTKEFRPVFAGSIWTLRPDNSPQADQQVNRSDQVTLPIELAEALNTLNVLQQEYDQANFEIESLSSQLFADWYKYMLCAYPPLDTPDDYPDIDEAKRFIETNYLDDQAALKQKIGNVGNLNFGMKPDAAGQSILWADQPGENLANKIVQAVMNLLDSDAMRDFHMVVETDIGDWNGFFDKLDKSALLTGKYSPASTTRPEEQKARIANSLKELNNLVFPSDSANSMDFGHAVEGTLDELPDTSKKLITTLKTTDRASRHVWLRLNRLLLESLFPEHIAHRPNYVLKKVPAPRYWEPNDPVVLLAGDVARYTDRHGPEGELQKGGYLKCGIISGNGFAFENIDGLNKIREDINSKLDKLGYQNWLEQPWNPIMMEWQVGFSPAQQESLTDIGDQKNKVGTRYQLNENDADFSNSSTVKSTGTLNVYSGRSILTPHARNQLKGKLEEYLKEELLDQYYQARAIKTDEREISLLGAQIKDIRTWYEQSLASASSFGEPIYTAIRTYETLQKTNVLAQSLGGFNQALLMLKQTLQLPVDDLLGFEDYQEFTRRVSAVVGKINSSAPQHLNNFNPIRAGSMKLLRLRLVDTFGQVQEIDCEDKTIQLSETLPPRDEDEKSISLPPRLAQPGRINFRWLAAEGATAGDDEAEMNDHPATSPICGWILPNHLDGSLMIYEPNGQALGSLDQEGGWHYAPGRPPRFAWDIPNPHLRKLINYLYKQGQDFLKDFLTTLENALENIDPENFAHYESLALLIGRPIAVVRASLNLELRGRPAINQDWNVFRQDIQATATQKDSQQIEHLIRTTDGFTKVAFPIRIGEFEQLNDGLIGYWVEAENGYENDSFYAPQTTMETPHQNIIMHHSNSPAMIQQSIDDPPHKLTMLLDPRGVVHATCGILPTKSIRIPADQFADALRSIEATFLSAPVLTDIGSVNLPLPDEPGYQWSWLEKENGVWADESMIRPVNTQATFAAKQAIREGWLTLRPRPDQKPS